MKIQKVINKYFQSTSRISFKACKGGAINQTYLLTRKLNGGKKYYKLQKMNKIFNTSLMEDIEFITKYLVLKKIKTISVVKTLDNHKFVKDGSFWWRMLTYIPGRVFGAMPSFEHAKKAGKLVGEFHNALFKCKYKLKFKLKNYHNIDYDMKKLENTLKENKNTKKHIQLKNTAENILMLYKKFPKNIILPKRIIHNDLKISNVIFDKDGTKALSLIDLDTLSYGTMNIELGDALRSWCMVGGEDTKNVRFNINIYNSALKGYFSVVKFLTNEEKKSISQGVQLMTLDLAARFIIDAFNESYFTLNSLKYKNLFEQNKKRAENQMKFFEKFTNNFK